MPSFVIDVKEVKEITKRHPFYVWMTQQFDGAIILDLGTSKGRSALCFAQNPKNLVITYDVFQRAGHHLDRYHNIIYKIFDVIKLNPSWFSKVDIICLDISHNGEDEARFLELIEPHFKGILIMDDVEDSQTWPELAALFNNLKREHHLLPASIKASRGTGVVPYGDWTIVIKGEDSV